MELKAYNGVVFQPLFLYFPLQSVHGPPQAPAGYTQWQEGGGIREENHRRSRLFSTLNFFKIDKIIFSLLKVKASVSFGQTKNQGGDS